MLKDMFDYISQQKKKRKETKEKADIAKMFNDRYTYSKRYIDYNNYAWMCPECNKIHETKGQSAIDGLHYPKCCSTPEGHRTFFNIKYRI